MGTRVILSGFDEFAARCDNTVGRTARLERTMDAHTALIWAAVVKGSPVGVTSHLRGSWRPETLVTGAGGVIGIVGSPLDYSEVVERGRTPGAKMPPPDALATWVATKLGADVSPFVVARSIGRKGIKEVRMLQKAVAMTTPAARALWAAAARDLLGGD